MDRARRRKKKERRRKRRDEKEAKAKAKEEEKSIRGRLNPKHSRHVPSNRNSSNVGAGGEKGINTGALLRICFGKRTERFWKRTGDEESLESAGAHGGACNIPGK